MRIIFLENHIQLIQNYFENPLKMIKGLVTKSPVFNALAWSCLAWHKFISFLIAQQNIVIH